MDTIKNHFLKKFESLESDIAKQRERVYQHKLKNRNFFQKIFNIQPDMSFVDMCHNSERLEMYKMKIEYEI